MASLTRIKNRITENLQITNWFKWLPSLALPNGGNLPLGNTNGEATRRRSHPPPFAVKTRARPSPAQFDELLIWVWIGLLALGLVMVYSASIATAEANKFTGYQSSYYLLRHAVFIATGLLAALFTFQVPVQTWQKYALYLFLMGGALLLLVLIPGIGREVNGSRRWLSFFVINVQPSEFMKLSAVLYAADYTVRKGKVGHLFKKAACCCRNPTWARSW
jgi:cell division protein FtsW (lipid II flippase)